MPGADADAENVMRAAVDSVDATFEDEEGKKREGKWSESWRLMP